ncbi:MAG: FecR domain-containing protein [Leptospirales bacterium]|nr:FecR domain-containing protein [Leptospirales bacterium]
MSTQDKEFQPYERLLRRTPSIPRMPEFQAEWLQAAPQVPLSEVEIRRILRASSTNRSFRPWLAVAAALVVCSGIGLAVWNFSLKQGVPENGNQAIVLGVRGQAIGLQGPAAQPLAERGAAEAEWLQGGQPLAQGARLRAGDWIVTGPESAADLGLPGGTVIRLSANSRLSMDALARESSRGKVDELMLHRGRLLNVVERLNQGDEFNVRTPTAIAGVRGTSFRVSTDGRATEIYVVRGAVEVRPSLAPTQAVSLGQNEVAEVASASSAPAVGQSEDPEFVDERELDDLARRLEGDGPALVATGASVDSVLRQAREQRQREYNRIILNNGQEIRGLIVSQVGRRMFIETEGRSFVLSADEVKEVLLAE